MTRQIDGSFVLEQWGIIISPICFFPYSNFKLGSSQGLVYLRETADKQLFLEHTPPVRPSSSSSSSSTPKNNQEASSKFGQSLRLLPVVAAVSTSVSHTLTENEEDKKSWRKAVDSYRDPPLFWCCWTLCADGGKKNKMGITFCLLPPSQIDVTTLAAGGYLPPPPPPLPPVFPCHKALRTRRSEMEPEKGDRSWIHQLVHKKEILLLFRSIVEYIKGLFNTSVMKTHGGFLSRRMR